MVVVSLRTVYASVEPSFGRSKQLDNSLRLEASNTEHVCAENATPKSALTTKQSRAIRPLPCNAIESNFRLHEADDREDLHATANSQSYCQYTVQASLERSFPAPASLTYLIASDWVLVAAGCVPIFMDSAS